jgi:hypothetical protein
MTLDETVKRLRKRLQECQAFEREKLAEVADAGPDAMKFAIEELADAGQVVEDLEEILAKKEAEYELQRKSGAS